MICLAGTLGAGPAEYELNLVRNAAFQPGMDRQGPKAWTYWPVVTNNNIAGGGGPGGAI